MEEQGVFTSRQHFSLWMQAMCAQWSEVTDLGRRIKIGKDRILFGDGKPINGIYYLARGAMRFLSCNHEGEQAILFYVTAGNLLGDAAMFNKMPVYAMYSAVEDCTLYFFDEKTVRNDILPRHPHLAQNLMEYMAYKIGVLLHHHCEIINTDVRGKVCRLLFDIVQHCGYKRTIAPKITQAEMAAALGLHRATFNRIIAELKTEGVLEKVTKTEIVINDLEALGRYADKPFAL